jgi:hypothetical protein
MATDLMQALQLLCEIDPPDISGQWVDRHKLKPSIELLIAAGALVPSDNVSSVLCEMCDHSHWIVPEHFGAGNYRGYCPVAGYHSLSAESLRCFVLNDNWIVDGIAGALGLRRKRSQVDKTPIVGIGRTRFGPYYCELLFGRQLADRSRIEKARAVLNRKIGEGIGVLLTATRLESLPGVLSQRCSVVAIEDALTISNNKIGVESDVILAALRDPTNLPKGSIGFRHSPGFRLCAYGGQQFRFTHKQSLAIEALHDAWHDGLPGLHQDELKGKVGSSQRITSLFAGSPAYGRLIKNDGGGLYWLDL